ncbi:DUF2794 domain-containing protein [Bartonella tamiae]|uniref:DUF2794 domain-containing protein n=1 Tax=Bartonella tamiae Th239 TaxID=1094558 RepID=J1K168_9HYPH|nr:DUF2794 domain-containing protein [Bartonella tamiae]EJF91192.1 hypothetical protein ME5_00524 [Bartonella tamiae Th239]EJF93143.1 hypothetical protein MEG_01357 [Bartonella tamiae Th307]
MGQENKNIITAFTNNNQTKKYKGPVAFNRIELDAILRIYGQMVAAGIWRDYAIDYLDDYAVFSIFRRTSEVPIYRIEKNPKRAQKQGAYSILGANNVILKRGHDIKQVLKFFNKSLLKIV